MLIQDKETQYDTGYKTTLESMPRRRNSHDTAIRGYKLKFKGSEV
jgi:hypothetical protein